MWRSAKSPDGVKGLAGIAMVALLMLALLVSGCGRSPAPDSRRSIGSIAGPCEFSVPRWEMSKIAGGLWESLKPATEAKIDDIETVEEYLAAAGQGSKTSGELEDRAERVMARQIREALIEEGIVNPLDDFVPVKVVFPPVDFEFQSPPNLLVVSPRNKIRLLKRRTLDPGLSTEEKGQIEAEVDALGYSSLVVGLGGIGFSYPTMVVPSSNIRWTIDTATEEWFHQYMFFHPLGFLYALDGLGWRPDDDVITMNETVAGIVSKEIGARVYGRYYAEEGEESVPVGEGTSEFDLLMRQIRLRVDELLAEGKVDEAEGFMRQRRDFLASKGYHIRKLNQAYFAFYGTYGDEPTTVSPIGRDLQTLREQSSSLSEFLEKAKVMKSYDDLKRSLGEAEE